MKTSARRQKEAGRAVNLAARLPGGEAANRARGAFSLIELLVVIGVIVLLAGMTFPVVNAVKRTQAIHRARAELTYVEAAIQAYKEKLGYYPPDNPTHWTENQLYYELMGTVATAVGNPPTVVSYKTLDGSAQIQTATFPQAFLGNAVVGFMNSTKAGGGDEVAGAVQFLRNLKPAQFLVVNRGTASAVTLGVSMSGATVANGPTGEITPYGYCSTNPKYNAKAFDLWVDIIAGGKITRICNWSDKPLNPTTTAY